MSKANSSSIKAVPDIDPEAKLALSERNTNARRSLREVASNFAKMEIIPFEIVKGTRNDFPSKMVKINPESYSRKFDSEKACAKKMVDGVLKEVKVVEFTESVSFDLWFDGTGAIPGSEPVADSIQWLESNLIQYKGDIHSTRYVQLFWGTLSFYGQLKSLSVDYQMFSRNGEPLRAKATLGFQSIIEPELKEAARAKKSPDLTHMRIVKAGDNLPLMCFHIYKDPFYYLQVAEANGLANFTNIQPGQAIYFPPLKA